MRTTEKIEEQREMEEGLRSLQNTSQLVDGGQEKEGIEQGGKEVLWVFLRNLDLLGL